MKKLFPPILVILITGSILVNAQSAVKATTPAELANSLSRTYTDKDLGSLRAEGFFHRTVRIVIEHSLAEDGGKPLIEDATFRSFAAAEKWLTDRRPADYPFGRVAPPLVRCAKGICTYEEGAMNHNSLFLTKVTYGMRGGRPHIKAIYFIDGD